MVPLVSCRFVRAGGSTAQVATGTLDVLGAELGRVRCAPPALAASAYTVEVVGSLCDCVGLLSRRMSIPFRRNARATQSSHRQLGREAMLPRIASCLNKSRNPNSATPRTRPLLEICHIVKPPCVASPARGARPPLSLAVGPSIHRPIPQSWPLPNGIAETCRELVKRRGATSWLPCTALIRSLL